MTAPDGGAPHGADAALCDALATEHGAVYGYGMVSAYSSRELNTLVAATIRQHRDRRDRLVDLLSGRSVTAPAAAAGYRLPAPLTGSADAARLAVRIENDAAIAWRAVIEQAVEQSDREFAATALGQSAVLAAQWSRALGVWPITRAFPGGPD